MGKRRYWAVLANPSVYDIVRASRELREDTWLMPKGEVEVGDGIAFWKTLGDDANRGVVALGRVQRRPIEVLRSDLSLPYWVADPPEEVSRGFRLEYLNAPGCPLWWGEDDAFLSSLTVSRAQGNKLYRLSSDQWEELCRRAAVEEAVIMASVGGASTGVAIPRRRSFDRVLERLADLKTSLTEAELLRASHWELGQDARLREDARFRQTPWNRWMRAEDLLANDAVHRSLHAARLASTNLSDALEEAESLFGRRCAVCPGDPRLVVHKGEVRLAASELSDSPVVEGVVGDLEKYTTHLPLQTLQAAAASAPLGEWGSRAQEEIIEPVGWVPVALPDGRRPNPRMFIARLRGHSMDDGSNALRDGAYVVFEFDDSDPFPNEPIALVRGDSLDPEAGSFAVKRFRSERDDEGRTTRVTLVSLNPDQARFPDIAVDPSDGFRLVARVVVPLTPTDYARRPKPLRRRGRRDLKSDEARRQVHRRLKERASRFFEPVAWAPTDNAEPDTTAWNSQVVCLEAEAGGLHLEIGPLVGLWKFVKVLVARSAMGKTRQTLASNARLRPVRLPVLPTAGAWTWGADGFEDDPDVDLSALDVPGVPHDRVSAFRVAADGVGKLLAGDHLSPGQAYRLLVPPEVWEGVDCSIPTTVLGDGWRLAELALPAEPRAELVDDLEKLGFGLGDLTPSLSFALASWPDEWRATARGEGFACFSAGEDGADSVLIAIAGYEAEVDDEAQLFVHGPGGPRRVSLPAGSTANVELSGLSTGQYFCTLLHQRTRVQPAHLPFEVAADLAAPPQASLNASVAGESITGAPNAVTRAWRGDLALLAQDEVAVEGPPGWPARVLWREVTDDYLATLELDAAEQLDVPRLFSLTRERRERRLLGDLVLDCGELGSLVLEHERHATAQGVGSVLGELARTKGDFVRRRAGAFTQLLPMWFEPVGQCLGYEVETVAELPEEPPVHAAAARLLVTERRADGIGRRCKRVLVMLEELQSELDEGLLDWIDGVCLRFGVDNALISTGLSWAEHRRRSRLPLKVWELDEVLAQDELLIAFLRDVAEGV